MKTLLILAVWLGNLSAVAHAGGGSMVGGGDLKLITAIACDAEGIDPTHPVRGAKLEVLYEADEMGNPIPRSQIKVAIHAEDGEYVAFYQTRLRGVPTLPASFQLFDYNHSRARVMGKLNLGYFGVVDYLTPTPYGFRNGAEELVISNCDYVVHAQDESK